MENWKLERAQLFRQKVGCPWSLRVLVEDEDKVNTELVMTKECFGLRMPYRRKDHHYLTCFMIVHPPHLPLPFFTSLCWWQSNSQSRF